MVETLILDTNLILRFLLKDEPVHHKQAIGLLQRAKGKKIKLFLDQITLAETVWVLKSFHRLPKSSFCPQLKTLVSQAWVEASDKKLLLSALDLYQKNNLDFADAWLYSQSRKLHSKIATFDKDFDKLDPQVRYRFN